MRIFIAGHISPDLDTVASAIEYKEYLFKTKRYKNAKLIPVISGKPNNETGKILKKFNAKLPQLLDTIQIEENDKFILVDHNELNQRHPKVANEKVIEIVDHHKVNLNFQSPIMLDVKPLGSTSTLIYDHFKTAKFMPSTKIAQLTLAAILSDTQGLKSGTTTGIDVEYANELSQQLHIDINKLTFDIFKAASDITNMTPEEIVTKDFKIFDFVGKKVFISVLETVEPEKVLKQNIQLKKALEEVRLIKNTDQAYFFIVDVLNINTKALVATKKEEDIIEKAFITKSIDGIADIGPRTSRKKDIAPAIEKALAS